MTSPLVLALFLPAPLLALAAVAWLQHRRRERAAIEAFADADDFWAIVGDHR